MRLGLDVLLDDPWATLGDARVGLICHPASVDHRYRHAADLFHAHNDINLTTLFGPQHGIWGQTQDDMIEWEGFTDARTDLPVYSLYGAHRTPTPEMLTDTDVLVVDLQDVGTRIYTFIYTMALAMQAARQAGKRVVVLDQAKPDQRRADGRQSARSGARVVRRPLPAADPPRHDDWGTGAHVQ